MSAAIQRTREERGLTRTQLEQRMGMAPSTIYALEKGHGGLSMAMMHRLASALNCGWDDILGPPPDTAPGEDSRWRAGYRAGLSDALASVRDLMNGDR